MSELKTLPLVCITPSPNNPRKAFDADAMAELVESIRTHGIIQPVLVRPLPDGDYELIAGERRYRGATEAGLEEIPCMVVEATEQEALELSIIENLQRKDITAMEEAEGFQRWLILSGQPTDELIAKVGKSRSYVYATLKLLDLTESVAERVRNGELSRSIAMLVSRISDPARQDDLARKLMDFKTAHGYGESRPMTHKEALAYVRVNASQALKSALFDLEQQYGNLTPCSTCPKRSCNDMLILAEHKNDPDVCTDPACFEVKTQRHLEPQAEELRGKGHFVVIGGGQPPKGYKLLDSQISMGNYSYKTVKELLGKKLLPKPIPMWIPTERNNAGKPVPVIAEKDFKRIVKEHGLIKKPKTSASAPVKKVAPWETAWHAKDKFAVYAEHRAATEAMAALFDGEKPKRDDMAELILLLISHDDFETWFDPFDEEDAREYFVPEGQRPSDVMAKGPNPVKAFFVAATAYWRRLPSIDTDNYPPSESEPLTILMDKLGIDVEPTDADRAAAEERWPTPVPETPVTKFNELFGGNKIRKKGKKAAAEAPTPEAGPTTSPEPVEAPAADPSPPKRKPRAGKLSKAEAAERLAEELQAAEQQPVDAEPNMTPLHPWPSPGIPESPGPGFEWDAKSEQWLPKGAIRATVDESTTQEA